MASPSHQIAFLKLNENGSRDNAFAYGGLKIVNFRDAKNEQLIDLATDRLGRIVALLKTSSDELQLLRLGADGELDESFSQDGLRRITPTDDARNFRIAVDGENRIAFAATRTKPGSLSVGTVGPGPGPVRRTEFYIEVRRFSSTGVLESNFGLSGHTVIASPKGPDCRIESLKIGRNNSIFVGATVGHLDPEEVTLPGAQTLDMAVFKLDESGGLASDFGAEIGGNHSGGRVIPNSLAAQRILDGIELTAKTERIVCWGRERHGAGAWNGYIAALTGQGDFDTRYADNGSKHFGGGRIPVDCSTSHEQKPFRRGVTSFSRLAVLLVDESGTGSNGDQSVVLLEENGDLYRDIDFSSVLDSKSAWGVLLQKQRRVLLAGPLQDGVFVGLVNVPSSGVFDDPAFAGDEVFASFSLNADQIGYRSGDGRTLATGRARPRVLVARHRDDKVVIAVNVGFVAGDGPSPEFDPNDFAPPEIET